MNSKPTEQLRLSYEEDDCSTLANRPEHPVAEGLLERMLSSANLRTALRQVERNKGSAGVDGRNIRKIIEELRRYLLGWNAYFGISQYRSVFKELDSWIRRRLRCYHWKQWGRRGYRELRRRGVRCVLAWNTAKSAYGLWRLSRSSALSIALPGRYFDALGLARLYDRTT